MNYTFGYPEWMREEYITKQLGNPQLLEKHYEKYHGKYRPLPVIEVPIELLVYRMENIRTKTLQKEYLALTPDCPRDIFTSDPYCIEAQETQHQILKMLVDKENLLTTFKKDDKLQQTEPLICANNGIVVNGNRRLCAWRVLYYGNSQKYAHFRTVRVAVLPDNDPKGMEELEKALQIHSDMKAEYSWHTKAAYYKEKFDLGQSALEIAGGAEHKKQAEVISVSISCYEYAAKYLESIGHPDEWSRVDQSEYAFKQIVAGRKNLNNPGDKELFQEIAQAMLQVPASGERLYSQIPKVAKHLSSIATKLQEELQIELRESEEDDLDLLLGGDTETDDTNAQIAAGIRDANDPETVVKTVKTVLETVEALDNEKKKKSYIFDQVKKAATFLTNAVSNWDDSMSKEGVGKQIENIEGALAFLKDWIK